VRPDQWEDGGWEQLELQVHVCAEEVFHRAWVCSLLKEALDLVRKICEEKGQGQHWVLFEGRHLAESPKTPSWKDLGAPFGLDEKEACTRAATVARHFRVVLRQLVSEEVGSAEQVDAEIENLLTLV
jgi:hypothetical protein